MEQDRIEEIVARLMVELGGQAPPAAAGQGAHAETVAVIAAPLALPDTVLGDVRETFGERVRYLVFGDHLHYPQVRAVHRTGADEQTTVEEAARAESLLLLSPTVATLAAVAAGEEAGPVESLVLRALLWGKPVHIWLDFLPVRLRRGTLLAKVLDAVAALQDMGAHVTAFDWLAGVGARKLPTLVTEHHVLEAEAAGLRELACAPGAVVTPLARDRAAAADIRIVKTDR